MTTSPAVESIARLLALVNTADHYNEVDELRTGSEATRCLSGLGLLTAEAGLSDTEAKKVREVREHLRNLASTNTTNEAVDPSDLRSLAGLLAHGRLRVHLDVAGPLTVRLAADQDGPLSGVLGQTAAALHELVLTGAWERFKACANLECRWAFYDRSRSRTGRWCDMGACGNLMKARAYRRRRRGLAEDE